MDYETLVDIQGYVKFSLVFIVFVIFYSYVFSMYKRDKSGEKDYEKYSKLVLDDSISSNPLESRENRSENKDKEN